MSLSYISVLSERSLKAVCVFVGILFLGISAHVWFQGELQANDARPLILIPLSSAVVLLAGAALLKKEALGTLLVFWFVGVPALFWLVNTVACGAGWFSSSWCQ